MDPVFNRSIVLFYGELDFVEDQGVDVFGPSLAPLGFLRGRHRGRALVRTEKTVDMQAVIAAWIDSVTLPPGVRLQVDIDPYSFL